MARLSIVAESIKSSKNTLRKIIVDKNPSFYESTRFIFGFAQAFAVMPLNGLWKRERDGGLAHLSFNCGSINTIYCVCVVLSVGGMCVIAALSTVVEYGLRIGKICKTIKWFI